MNNVQKQSVYISMSDTKPGQRRYQRTYRTILEAAQQLIAEKGVAALSMRSLAAEADYSAGALYKYFDSKDDLLSAVAEAGFEQLADAVEAAIMPDASPPDNLRASGRAYQQFALNHPEIYKLMFSHQKRDDKTILHGALQDRAFNLMKGVIEQGIDNGDFTAKDDYGAVDMAFHAWTLTHGIVMLRIAGVAAHPDFEDISQRVFKALQRGMR
jgi:AcrR family transcriptional regulator